MATPSYKDLPDFPHIRKICECLWTEREYGKAAIMVGSGFSKNAEPSGGTRRILPSWKELANGMFDELYAERNTNAEKFDQLRNDKTASTGMLKLASEYEAYFGRNALNNFLLKAIPDEDFVPGVLHENLMNLPWSDVFTTNYDTLLERTLKSKNLYSKRYDLVLTKEDLPGKMKPRIVKLHGSFPSYYPFLITEEDYRKYPSDFAPFVNTVQQSMMENVFCLIGFSGNDPNFLAWRGWIRDNLKQNAPTIYLVGIFEISDAEKRLIESNFVKIVDLSAIFPYHIWKTDISSRNYEAIKWFLEVLGKSKPPQVIYWPKIKF